MIPLHLRQTWILAQLFCVYLFPPEWKSCSHWCWLSWARVPTALYPLSPTHFFYRSEVFRLGVCACGARHGLAIPCIAPLAQLDGPTAARERASARKLKFITGCCVMRQFHRLIWISPSAKTARARVQFGAPFAGHRIYSDAPEQKFVRLDFLSAVSYAI